MDPHGEREISDYMLQKMGQINKYDAMIQDDKAQHRSACITLYVNMLHCSKTTFTLCQITLAGRKTESLAGCLDMIGRERER